MKHQLILSIHVPKTAGTSFQAFLSSALGDNLLLDYRSKPLDIDYEARAIANLPADTAMYREIKERLEVADVCVHGHFYPAKYLAIFPQARLVSWVREPAQRLMSHYQFWQQNPQPDHSIARQVVEGGLSFEEFCQLPMMQNINSRFLGDLSLSRYDCIGVTENYPQSLSTLCHSFNWSPPAPDDVAKKRENPLKTGEKYTISADERNTLLRLNRRDYALYQRVLSNSPP